MIAEFEPLYRLLGLADQIDAAGVRQAYTDRVAMLENQKAIAGSRPERMIATKALREVTGLEEDVGKLATVLDALADWTALASATREGVAASLAEARKAVAKRKAASATRHIGRARTAAQKAGASARELEKLVATIPGQTVQKATDAALRLVDESLDAIAEAEAELADSGLVHDSALDAEIGQVEARLAAAEEALDRQVAATTTIADEAGPALEALQLEVAGLQARSGARRSPEVLALLELVSDRIKTCMTRRQAWRDECVRRAQHERVQAMVSGFEAAWPPEAVETATRDELLAAIGEIDTALADPVWTGPAPDGAPARFEVERSRLAALRDHLQAAADRPPPEPVAPPPEEPAPPASPPPPPPAPIPAPAAIPAGPATPIASVEMPPPEPGEVTVVARQAPPPAALPEPVVADRFTLVHARTGRCHVVSADEVTFGRSSSSDVVVRGYSAINPNEELRVSQALSRVHFTILKERDDMVLADGGPQSGGSWKNSANGTFGPDGKQIERTQLFRTGLGSFRVTQEASPANIPRWDLVLQMRARLPEPLAPLRDAQPAGPDALLLRRADGLREDVLLLWRAANLLDFGLAEVECCIVRHRGGFLLWQDGRLVPLETRFRVAGAWTVGPLGKLEYRA